MTSIDARFYGRENVAPLEPSAQGVGAIQEPVRDVPVGSVKVGEAGVRGAQIQQGVTYAEPTMWESWTAGVADTSFMRSLEYYTRPTFPMDGPDAPKALDFIKNSKYVLTEAEYNAVVGAKNTGERQWLMDRIEESREKQMIAGEHGAVALAASIVGDPTTFIGGFAALRAGKAVQAAAAARGVAAARAVGPLSAAETLVAANNAAVGATGAARVAASAASVVVEGGTNLAASQTAPISNAEQAFNILAMGVGGAMVPQAGKLKSLNKDFPQEAMQESVLKPHMRLVSPAEYADDGFGNTVKSKDAVFEELPRPLRAGANATVEEVADAVDTHLEAKAKTWGQTFGETVMWNVNKSMRKLGALGDDTADILVDNNHKYGLTSVESEAQAVQRALGSLQWSYESAFRAGLAERGHGTIAHLVANRATREASAKLEHDIAMESMRRERLFAAGKPITPDGIDPLVYKLAEQKSSIYKAALKEMKDAGVLGADVIEHNPGYFQRVHAAAKVERVLDDLVASGMTEQKARASIVNMYRGAIRRANKGMDDETAGDVAGAIVDRTLRRGRMEDGGRNSTFGIDTAAEVRDMLKHSGVPKERIDRVIEAMMGKVDEQGKASYLKHRIDMDYTAGMMVNGKLVQVADLIETNVNTLLDSYIKKVSAQVAFTKKGLNTPSAIKALRDKYTRGATDREAAGKMFDNVIAHISGMKVGDSSPEFMRNASAFGRMITLAASGIWQATEYVNMMQRYGVGKTLTYTMAELPIFKSLMETAATDKQLSTHLKDILTNMAEQNVRMRPFLQKFEDNFEIPKDSRIAHMAQQGQQLIPYVNFMKYMHSHQARLHSNLLLDVIKRAANGDATAMEHLTKYGVKSQGIDKLKNAVNTHGFEVDKWDDGVWTSVRPALTKMTDESILHARMGDMPAFALMNDVGKFVFAYRSFILTSHNKVFAGTASREGLGAVALMAAYQFPLSAMAVQVNEVAKGREPLDGSKLITKAIGQMGALGLTGEISNVLFGGQGVTSPAFIPFDKTARFMGSSTRALLGDGDGQQAFKDGLNLIPVLNTVLGIGAVKNMATKEE